MKKAAALALLAGFVLAVGSCQARPVDPSPAFRLTRAELAAAIDGLPAETCALIMEQPARFLELMAATLAAPEELLALVDKANSLPASALPRDLVDLSGRAVTVTRAGLKLRAVTIPDLEAMAAEARALGITLPLSSTYRSYEYQESLYRNALVTQSRESVERELARPGHSEHQLGTTMDFGSIDASFADTAAGRWLAEHAWRYGFVMSYPPNTESETGYVHEPWHFRYLGRSAAALVHDTFSGKAWVFLRFYNAKRPLFQERLVERPR